MTLHDVSYAGDQPTLFPARRVASVAVIHGGRLLMGVRRDSGRLTLPGGGFEVGETPEQAARRELSEEAGLTVTGRLEPLGDEAVRVQGDRLVRVYAFRCFLTGVPTGAFDPDQEVVRWLWVPFEPEGLDTAILARLHSPQNVVLKLLGLQDFPALEIEEHIAKARSGHGAGEHPPIRDLKLEGGKWYEGKVYFTGTPLGVAFRKGEEVYVRTWRDGHLVLYGNQAVRYVTPQQVVDTTRLRVDTPVGEQEYREAQYQDILARLLAAPDGRLHELHTDLGEEAVPEDVALPLRGFVLHVTRRSPYMNDPDWYAMWLIDRQGQGHVFYEARIFREERAWGWWDEMRLTVRHEVHEAVWAVEWVREVYGSVPVEKLGGLAEQFQGLAHIRAVREIDGYTDEARYNLDLEQKVRKLGLARNEGPWSTKDVPRVEIEPAEPVARAVSLVLDLAKAAPGSVKPGHRYLSREGGPGEWRYRYAAEQRGRTAIMANLAKDPAYHRVGPQTGLDTYPRQIAYLKRLGGMRQVTFDRRIPTAEKLHHLRGLAEAMRDLTDVLNLPTPMMSYNGRLAVRVKAGGLGWTAATYTPREMVLELTRHLGAGSIAHEWGHFLDNALNAVLFKALPGEWATEGYLSQTVLANADGGRRYLRKFQRTHLAEVEPVRAAMAGLMTHLRETFVQRMAADPRFKQEKDKFYWGRATEVFARAFEKYVTDRLSDRQRENRYLVNTSFDYRWPQADEIDGSRVLFDRLFEALRESPLLKKALVRAPPVHLSLATGALEDEEGVEGSDPRPLHVLRQPSKDDCGNAAFAIATRRTVERANHLLGHAHGMTYVTDMIRGLDRLNIAHGPEVEYQPGTRFPVFCLIETDGDTTEEGKWKHWIVLRRGVVYEPWDGTTWRLEEYVPRVMVKHDHGHFLRYVEIRHDGVPTI